MINNLIKKYGKVISCLMFLVLFFIPKLSLAYNQCSKSGYTILTVNGVLTYDAGARDNSIALARKLNNTTYNNQPLIVDYVLNPTHGVIIDSLDSVLQKYFDQNSFDVQDSDFAQMLTDASTKVATQKLLLVGHSQGNFYANTFYDAVADMSGGVPSESIGVYSLASPATHVAGDGLYLTSDTDNVIAGAVAKAPFTNILKPNVHIDFKSSDDGGMGHDFLKIYLNYEGDRIVSDIKTSLNKLKNNNIQDENSLCINPPKLTLAQKIQGTVLSILDPVTITAQDALVYVANGVSSVAVAVGNTTANITGSAISSVSSFFAPAANDINNLAVNDSGDAINALNQMTPPSSPTTNDTTVNSPSAEQPPALQDTSTGNIISLAPPVSSFPSFIGKGGGGEITTSIPEDNPGTITGTTTGNPQSAQNTSSTDDSSSNSTDSSPDNSSSNTSSGTDQNPADQNGSTTNPPSDSGSDTNTPPTNPQPSHDITTIDQNTTLVSGEYTYEDLVITNNATLTLQGDPNSSNSFKGVKINAQNITIDPGSSISANGQGYGQNSGPGISSEYSVGASYGGFSFSGVSYSTTYGSATKPMDLGSGGASSGGGAIYLAVSGALTDNGIISADGNTSSSGGSIYINADDITGNGVVHANGGNLLASGYFKSPGGGGRIAVHYQNSNFSGTIDAKGGCGSYDSYTESCGQSGTVGLFNESTDDLFLTGSSWKFLQADAPFLFNDIYISNGAVVTSEDGVTITAKNNFIVDQNSSFTLAKGEILNAPTLMVNRNSTLTLSGTEQITSSYLSVVGNSSLSIIPGQTISLAIQNINVDSGSFISADAKGYGVAAGPGAPTAVYDPNNPNPYYAGASYGGVGYLNTSTSTYGSSTMPTDLGSGGNGSHAAGGGAIRFIANSIINNGTISANGANTSSGGSIYITTNTLSGAGSFQANGGGLFCPYICYGPGGGGRIAIYYQTSSFTGTTVASGTNGNGIKSGDGTVYIVNESVPQFSSAKIISSFNFLGSNPSIVGVVDESNHTISLTVPYGTDVTSLVPTITISDKASISPSNITAQNFTSPVTYTVTAEDNSTQNYIVTVTVAPNPNPPSPPAQVSSPLITSYTFNNIAGDITTNPLTNNLTLFLSANENVNWMSVKIENVDDASIYKLFQSGAGCVDGTNTCTKTWDGILSKGGLLQNGTFRLKVHIQDTLGNEYDDYLSPYVINVSIPS